MNKNTFKLWYEGVKSQHPMEHKTKNNHIENGEKSFTTLISPLTCWPSLAQQDGLHLQFLLGGEENETFCPHSLSITALRVASAWLRQSASWIL